ncbi:hypothetical protein, partial [Nitrosococcus oceani]|uniref:hypothetical protein n=1 Tax=Nitrosococcus oceani TaxID=1229 RepID=UPI001E4F9E6A
MKNFASKRSGVLRQILRSLRRSHLESPEYRESMDNLAHLMRQYRINHCGIKKCAQGRIFLFHI